MKARKLYIKLTQKSEVMKEMSEKALGEVEGAEYATIIVGDYDSEEFRRNLKRWLQASFEREKARKTKNYKRTENQE